MNEEIIEAQNIETPLVEQNPQEMLSFDDKKLAKNQKFIKDVLENYEFHKPDGTVIKWDMESMLKSIFDDANSVIIQNNKGDIIPDYKSRAQLKIKLLEAAWVIRPKQTEIKVNFLSLLFWNK